MTVPKSPTVPQPPIQQWEDDGGAIPTVAVLNQSCSINVGRAERIASAIAGGAMLLHGLTRGSLSGLVTAALGGGLLYRGATGHCYLYQTLDISTADEADLRSMACCGSDMTCSEPSSVRSLYGERQRAGQSSVTHGSAPVPGPNTVPTLLPPFMPSTTTAVPNPPDRSLEGMAGSPPPGRT